ncbi:MAG TPA: phage holin family protein [Candidatus Avipropionibacterium avicola]|uniref:Phage holin family protein n=1 Tax=Candidatus Avipropionibacterium avicola TaxID=2840701 RepID=A0A9D1H1D5_9ACTN|nr:phage holin family protein [Candidatus Avipropionibacterium avicola]
MSTTPNDAPTEERGIGDLVKDITSDAQLLVQHEIELAKAELIPSVKKAGTGAGLFGGAGVIALYALGLIFLGCGFLIGDALGRTWLGMLIMAGGLLVVALICVLIGNALRKKADFSATATKANATASVNAVKGAVERASTAAKTPAIERHDSDTDASVTRR